MGLVIWCDSGPTETVLFLTRSLFLTLYTPLPTKKNNYNLVVVAVKMEPEKNNHTKKIV